MNNKDKTIWNKWDEIEYGLYTIASEATALLKQLNQLRASVGEHICFYENGICIHCEAVE